MKNSRYWRPVLESLDVRILPAVNFDSGTGVLTIDNEGKDDIDVQLVGSDIQVTQNGVAATPVAAASVTQIVIEAGNGKDVVTIGDTVLIDAVVDGGNGKDDITTGGGNDVVFGANGMDRISTGAGNDFADGANGKDDLDGGEGDDVLIGGRGKDRLDGGTGVNLLDAGDHPHEQVSNGLVVEFGLAASLTGTGSGSASIGVVSEADGTEGEFNVSVSGLTAGATVEVWIDGANVGSIVLDGTGAGSLNYSNDPDGGETAFPVGFTSVVTGSVIEIKALDSSVLLSGTFA